MMSPQRGRCGLIFWASTLISGASRIASGNTTCRIGPFAHRAPRPIRTIKEPIRRRPRHRSIPRPERRQPHPMRTPWSRSPAKPPITRTSSCVRSRRWKTCASGPNGRWRTPATTASQPSHAIFSRSPTTWSALGALDADLREKADGGTKALLDGVELTERELLKVLEKHGVKKFEPLDEKFDPNVHQAMFELPDPSRPAGTVARVIQPGYMIGERILRPALVAVAKGGPKASVEAPANDNAGASPRDPRGSR